MTMQLGYNLAAYDYYSPQWPSVNVAKYMSAPTFQRAGYAHALPLDADGAITAALSSLQTVLNIVNAEPGTDYGLVATQTVVTVDADHDLTVGAYVGIAGNTKVANGNYLIAAIRSHTQFVITRTIDAASGASGTATWPKLSWEWDPLAYSLRDIAAHFPAGTYDAYNGSDVQVQFVYSTTTNVNAASWTTAEVVPISSGIGLKANLHDWSSGGGFKLIMPGYKAAYEAGTTFWHPTYLSLLGANNSGCLRHMDSGRTNNSNVRTWAQRTVGTRWNSLHGKSTKRPIKITGSTSGDYSAYFGSAVTLTLDCPSHLLTTGDLLTVTTSNGTPNRANYKYIVEVLDGDTLRVKTSSAQTVEMTWGYGHADIMAGASYEDLIALANELGHDVWFCVPHLADNDYATQLGTLIETTLDPGLKAYIEYSNEVWQRGHPAFMQGHYCECQGRIDPTYTTQDRWAGKRAREIFALVDAAVVAAGNATPRARIVRVAASQRANTWITTEHLIGLTDPISGKVTADALAIAGYYTGTGTDLATLKAACLSMIDTELVPKLAAHKAIADATVNDEDLPLRMVAYEGGCGIFAKNSPYQEFATSTERYDCDLALFAAMEAGGMTLWNHYYFMGEAEVAGSYFYQWGALNYMEDVATSTYRPTWEAIVVHFETPPPPALDTPTGLTATTYSHTRIDLAWNDVLGETGYSIWRSTDGVDYTNVGVTNADVVVYSATGLTPDTLYYFKVQATGAVNSPLSAAASDTTDAAPLIPVMGFRSPFPFALGLMGMVREGTPFVEYDGIPLVRVRFEGKPLVGVDYEAQPLVGCRFEAQ